MDEQWELYNDIAVDIDSSAIECTNSLEDEMLMAAGISKYMRRQTSTKPRDERRAASGS